ncbi:MAG: type III-A CRISPR-associated RAMP protein Csm5 [Ignavibacteriae bacterium]|nr:type III-A CRISPR-associated RAMP protein Csm5 [Ignavibacteriota bacterium]NOH00232.1 type III-A CRISPR-associated RAMP protein Csm5 [Ignavibacteriota bacterium]
MKSDKYVIEKLNLTTLTPIFIGDDQGSDLSPITDFVVENSKAKIIDQNKFEEVLSKDIELIDEYVQAIKLKKIDLESFIKDKLNVDLNNLTKSEIEIEGCLANNKVSPFISSAGRPFIPGSTIKGAIRTAIFYNYLVQEIQNNNTQLKKFVNEKLNSFESDTDGHEFRHLQISDSNCIDVSDTKFIELFIEYLVKDHHKTSGWKQVLNDNTITSFQLKIEKKFKANFLQGINENTYNDVFKMANKFSCDIIDFELKRFEEFIENGKQHKIKLQETFKDIISFYTELKSNIKFGNNMFAVLRIGGGKTYFDNSIGLALFNYDEEKFKDFRKGLGFWKHSKKKGQKFRDFVEEDSPITRTFYYDKSKNANLPIGWCLIYFDKDKNDVAKIFKLEKTNKPKAEKKPVKKVDKKSFDKNYAESQLSHLIKKH